MNRSRKAMDTAVRILAAREHSRAQLERKLLDRGFDGAVVDEVLTRLREISYLDDARFAAACARERVLRRGYGFSGAMHKILEAGVAREIAETAIKDLRGEVDEKELCMKAAMKKAALLNETDRTKFREKVRRHLAGRGFEFEVIQDVVEELKAEEAPEDF